ncbi:MAG TPA: hypothetical protein VI933_03560 [archaeon]|nr:hypothetical protein [archaeon]
MPSDLSRQGVLESEFLFQLTSKYVKDGRDEMGLPNTHGYADCVRYAARAAMFLVLGKLEYVKDYLIKAKQYKEFTSGAVPELDVFIEATAAKAAFLEGHLGKANVYAEKAQKTAMALNGTTSEMAEYLLYVAELSLQIAGNQAGS